MIELQDDSFEFPRRTAYTTMRVQITDGDDQGPTFKYNGCYSYLGSCIDPQYSASVPSNAVVSSA